LTGASLGFYSPTVIHLINKGPIVRTLLRLWLLSALLFSSQAFAGYELVCKGRQARSNHKPVLVDCANRKDFVEKLGMGWRTLRRESIGGSMENLCWEAYNQARDMHPSISFDNISDSFLMRCNMGLAYVQ
jgi:hypothetical protein